ncbi:uncharacterized protein BJX67DRAFT_342817 [Aspergillus lucknowensis]|uniref:Uncharacterized protein n=1 Tax=Aspergillus lucknowensis TaxID=176173 RepID=A0ABR4M548_9EURO
MADRNPKPSRNVPQWVSVVPIKGSANITAFFTRSYILVLTLVYVGLALTSWTILCILNKRPLGRPKYETSLEYDRYALGTDVERWYRVANVISSAVGVVTLPLTTSVCALVAVQFTQPRVCLGKERKSRLTLRQVLTLANQGWASPQVLLSLPWKLRQNASLFLWLAIALHILGGIINPLQQLMVGQTPVMVVARPVIIATPLIDIPQLTSSDNLGLKDTGQAAAILKAGLSSARIGDSYNYLWHGASEIADSSAFYDYRQSDDASGEFLTFSRDSDIFMTELPSNFDSGLFQQFAPRINSSLSWEPISKEDFPIDCRGNNSFFRRYTAQSTESDEDFYYTASVCMPGNLSASPFAYTRDRQDFSETLYVDLSYRASETRNITFQWTLSTTAGYFELPSSINDRSPGPLLPKDPLLGQERCLINELCYGQDRSDYTGSDAPPPNHGYDDDGNFYLELVPAKGPLALLTIAMFGNDSFIGTRTLNPVTSPSADQQAPGQLCSEYPPLALLHRQYDLCDGAGKDQVQLIGDWLSIFNDTDTATPLLNQAAFLANQAILTQEGQHLRTFYVANIPADDIMKPDISTASMLSLSILLFVYLASLLILSLWGTIQPRWTEVLDAHAMLKIGASLGLRSRHVGDALTETDTLDQLPGWVGDADPNALVGRLAVGGQGPIQLGREYRQQGDFSL